MKRTSKLVRFVVIALFAISFVSCEEENLNPITKAEVYPLHISSTNLSCEHTLDWEALRENGQDQDRLYLIQNQESFDEYIRFDTSLTSCRVDFSINNVLLAYTFTRNLNVSQVFDTLWKLSANEYRWDIEYKYSGVTSPSIGELANIIVIPKISDTSRVSLQVIDGGTIHPSPSKN